MPKWLQIDKDNLHTKFSPLNVNFSSLYPEPLRSSRLAHEGIKKGCPPKKWLILSVMGLSNVKTVADCHKHAAYHNKQWWRLFNGINIDDLEWPWTSKTGVVGIFLAIFAAESELDRDRLKQPATGNCYRLLLLKILFMVSLNYFIRLHLSPSSCQSCVLIPAEKAKLSWLGSY